MKYSRVLMLMTAMAFMATAAMGNATGPERFRSGDAQVAPTTRSSLQLHLIKTSLVTAPSSAGTSLFVTVTTDGDDKKDPHPRSVHCPPDKDDHHNLNYRDDDHKGDGDKDKDKDKDKDHDHCGKGDDDKNP